MVAWGAAVDNPVCVERHLGGRGRSLDEVAAACEHWLWPFDQGTGDALLSRQQDEDEVRESTDLVVDREHTVVGAVEHDSCLPWSRACPRSES